MVVKINRYIQEYSKTGTYHGTNYRGIITDREHREILVSVETRNETLTKDLIEKCMDLLNNGSETND